jgi:hypothetical protein
MSPSDNQEPRIKFPGGVRLLRICKFILSLATDRRALAHLGGCLHPSSFRGASRASLPSWLSYAVAFSHVRQLSCRRREFRPTGDEIATTLKFLTHAFHAPSVGQLLGREATQAYLDCNFGVPEPQSRDGEDAGTDRPDNIQGHELYTRTIPGRSTAMPIM